MKKLLVGLLSISISTIALAAPKVSFDAQSALPPQLLNSGYSRILLPSISLNSGNGYSGTLSQFKAPIEGAYQLNANVSLDTGGQDCSAFILALFLNGNELRRLSRTGGGHQFELAGSTLVKLAINDVVDVRVFHNCANPIVVEADGRAYFSGALN